MVIVSYIFLFVFDNKTTNGNDDKLQTVRKISGNEFNFTNILNYKKYHQFHEFHPSLDALLAGYQYECRYI